MSVGTLEYFRKKRKNLSKISIAQFFQLLRRLVTMAAAAYYVKISLDASVATMMFALNKAHGPSGIETHLPSFVMHAYTGHGPIRSSPLFGILGNSTAPRNDSLYLSFTGPAFVPCLNSRVGAIVYNNAFLRGIFAKLVQDTAFNNTFLQTHELILPVIDCTCMLITLHLNTALRAFYLMRSISDPDDVLLMSLKFSTQDYSIRTQRRRGHAGLADMSFIRDMAQSQLNHYCAVAKGFPFDELAFKPCVRKGLDSNFQQIIHTVPAFPELELPKEMLISSRRGDFADSEFVQANIIADRMVLSATPSQLISVLSLSGSVVYRDLWARVHFIHLYFAIGTSFSLVVLVLTINQSFRTGSIWIGDAFASISNSLAYRGPAVILAWILNRFWTLYDFSANFAALVGHDAGAIDLRPIHADLLTIYLSLASMLGILLRERIDPALVVIAFELGFQGRFVILERFESVSNYVKTFAHVDLLSGMHLVRSVVSSASPMGCWTVHDKTRKNIKIICATLVPIFFPMTLIVFYAALRKLYRHFHPTKMRVLKVTSYSDQSDNVSALKHSYTIFEIATGAALQVRYGVVSDYENYLLIKGIRYTSADGIYCSGYVIVNGKFLVAMEDLTVVVLMKLTRHRFAKVYVHEVHGRTVQQTARLLYPSMLSWTDLVHLNINALT